MRQITDRYYGLHIKKGPNSIESINKNLTKKSLKVGNKKADAPISMSPSYLFKFMNPLQTHSKYSSKRENTFRKVQATSLSTHMRTISDQINYNEKILQPININSQGMCKY